MLLQQSPFRGEDEDEIYDAILADEPLYPIHMPRDSVSILQKLLTREPELRLGSGPTDAQEIMSQPFFRNINWDDVYNKRYPAPFMPQITSATDTSNFDSEFTSVTPVLTPVQSGMSFCSSVVPDMIADHFSSFVPSHARRIPRLLLLGRFRLIPLHLSSVVSTVSVSCPGGSQGLTFCQLYKNDSRRLQKKHHRMDSRLLSIHLDDLLRYPTVFGQVEDSASFACFFVIDEWGGLKAFWSWVRRVK
jgi:serine/threonine protein kinase